MHVYSNISCKLGRVTKLDFLQNFVCFFVVVMLLFSESFSDARIHAIRGNLSSFAMRGQPSLYPTHALSYKLGCVFFLTLKAYFFMTNSFNKNSAFVKHTKNDKAN